MKIAALEILNVGSDVDLSEFKELGDFKDSAEHVASIEAFLNESKVGRLNAKVNFRIGPGTSYGKMSSLPADTECTVYEIVMGDNGKKWAHIAVSDETGFVMAEFIDFE